MDELYISAINNLQKVSSEVNATNLWQLPQIVVVGSQSAGKSSILERIVGWDFLPRGVEMVTRMPLVLTIVKCPEGDPFRDEKGAPEDCEFGIFDDNKGRVFEMNELSAEIERITNEKAGDSKEVKDVPILLTIYSLEGPPLALVDLPGLVTTHMDGQSPEVVGQIKKMVTEYITNENAIILAANNDTACSMALEMAQSVDPDGDRTIGVYTKLDIMDRGTDAMDLLTGKKKKIKKGIVGVVNRSQADQHLTLAEVEENERAFFRDRYPTLAETQGCGYLKKMLSENLVEHIRLCLPAVEKRLADEKVNCEAELEKLGEKVEHPRRELIRSAHAFGKQFVNRTKSGADFDYDRETKKLSSAAEIAECFSEELVNKLDGIEPLKDYTLEDLQGLLKSKAGLDPNLFPHPGIFLNLIKKPIADEVLPAALKCAEDVHKKLQQIFDLCDTDSIFHRFGKVKNLFKNALYEMLREQLELTEKMIKTTVRAHSSYINTEFRPFQEKYAEIRKKLDELNPDGSPKNATPAQVQNVPAGHSGLPIKAPNAQELDALGSNTRNALFIQEIVPAYFSSICDVISDTVSKLIVDNMIDYLDEELIPELLSKMDGKDIASLFLESVEVEEARKALKNKKNALKEAESILDKIGTL